MSNDSGYSLDDWQGHYDSGDLPWDLGEISPAIKRLWVEKKLVPGKAIVPGCGRGHEVAFLSAKGFQVTGVDYAPGAVASLQRSLAEKKLRARILHQNFFDLDPSHDGVYDLMLEQTFFCAISPAYRGLYVKTAARILKPGGLLAGLFYETGEEEGPPFNTTQADVRTHFADDFEIETLHKTPHSIARRLNKEWLGLLRKK